MTLVLPGGPVSSVASGLTPFSAYLASCAGVSVRRAPQVLAITLLGWAPAAVLLWLLLVYGVHIPTVSELLSLVDLGVDVGAGLLVTDRVLALQLSAGFILAYLLGQAVVTGALTHQMYMASIARPRSSVRSLGRSLARLHRTLPALMFMLVLAAVPFLAAAGSAGWVLYMDGTGWREPLLLALAVLGLVGALCLWAWGRLALWPAAAVLAPRGTFSPVVSLRATGRRWWQVVLRLVTVSLLVAAVVSAVSAPLMALGVSSSASIVAAAVTVRVVLSIASAALSSSASALIYADTDAPSA